jgi:Asp-tRNA(Asn)/Glu-tRNA(Gln) amidotransferase A subunit family amidase
VEDCALVLDAIFGPDGRDLSVVDQPFGWNAEFDVGSMRVGYLRSAFEEDREGQEEWKRFDERSLDTIRGMGFDLVPLDLPRLPIGAMSFILNVEAAAAFDELTRSNRDDLMARQVRNAWPNVFRQSRFVPAVEYLQANRVRSLLMQRMAEVVSEVDAYLAPSFSDNLLLTNLTGHPCVVLPNGFRSDGTPTSISFTGSLFAEAELLSLARAYQDATDYHLRNPKLQT